MDNVPQISSDKRGIDRLAYGAVIVVRTGGWTSDGLSNAISDLLGCVMDGDREGKAEYMYHGLVGGTADDYELFVKQIKACEWPAAYMRASLEYDEWLKSADK